MRLYLMFGAQFGEEAFPVFSVVVHSVETLHNPPRSSDSSPTKSVKSSYELPTFRGPLSCKTKYWVGISNHVFFRFGAVAPFRPVNLARNPSKLVRFSLLEWMMISVDHRQGDDCGCSSDGYNCTGDS
ncbi:hypothetical protein F7725_025882 [Dissostichus mawsoni]|uniref:Uncharacterized protein n=1 Tax=Dissostichus mawsoni TaxID=36200 RepID=A0A7J5X6C6_DISMA|nr:hypothetical protein F7725_025882 [Dissostichus mawsoni]